MSDKWHKDHKKAIAEKWVQCPQVSARKQELLSKWAIGQVGINALCEAHAHAEKELAEARAEIERLNKSFGDSLDTIFAMLLAARGAECDIDTLKAEMKPVSSKPSEYIKHTIAERDKLIEQMREALRLALSEARSTHCEQTILAALAAERV